MSTGDSDEQTRDQRAREEQAGSVAVASEAEASEQVAAEVALTAAPDVLAGSLGEYTRIWARRVRNGESGALPVIIGLIAIGAYFQISQHAFLSAANIANLMAQAGWIIAIAMAQAFVLLLGEIDLSVGYNAAVGATITFWMLAISEPVPDLGRHPGRPGGLRSDRRDRGPDHRLAEDPLLRGHAGRAARPERGTALALREDRERRPRRGHQRHRIQERLRQRPRVR